MKRYNLKTFYGAYGRVEEKKDGGFALEIIWNTYVPYPPFRKDYKTLKGVKIALGKMCETYTLEEVAMD